MKKRTRMLVIVLVMLLVTSVLPIEAGAYNTGDDYPEWIYCPVYLTEKDLKNSPIDTVQDPWNFWNRECTSFVAWCLNTRNHVEFTNQYKGVSRWGHAKEWINAANQFNDIIVDNNPGLGSVAWWGGGTYGHVAWVSSINGDGTITIEEYNNYEVAGASGIYSTRTISTSNVDKFIHIKDLDVTPPTVSSCVNVSNVSSNGFTLQFTATDDFGVTSVWADVRPGFSDAGAHRFQGNLSGSTATVVVETDLVAALSGSSSQNYYVTCGARDASENTAEVHVEHERISVYPVEIHSTGLNKTTGTFKTMQDTAGHYEPCEEIDGKSTESFFYAKGASVSGVGVYTNQWGATYLLTANGDWLYADHVKYQMQWSDIWDAISSFFNGNVTKIVYFAGQPLKSMETANQAKAPARLLAASNPSSIKLYGNVTTSTNSSGSYAVPSYKVYFDANGGSVSSSYKTVFANSTYGTLPTPYRLGYTFDGWFTAAEGGSLVTDATLISNSDHTLYAHWTRIVLLQGSCGANLSFILYGDGEMIVTGSGAMTSHPWTANAYRERVVDVSLPQDLTALCNSAFQNCTYLQTINLPNAETIPYYCFSGCSYLQTIALPSTLWAIDYHAFENCTALASIDIPDSVLYIGGYAFNGCSSLASVRLSENLKLMNGFISNAEERTWSNRTDNYYYNGAFRNCTSLKEIVIPASLARVPDSSFSGCSQMQSVTFKGTETSIYSSCFSGCKMLTDISLPAALKEIPSSCFKDCDSLVDITLPDTVKTIGSDAFNDCDGLQKIIFNPELSTIGSYAFNDCDSLKEVRSNAQLSSIGSYAFNECDLLETVELQMGLTSLGSYAFYKCPKISSLVLPQSLQSIGANCFAYDSGLTTVTIPDSVTSLGDLAFYLCDGLKNLGLGTGLTTIPQYCFWKNTSLEEVVIPYRVKTIEANAFANCTKLAKLTLPRSVTSIGTSAFSYADRMTVYGISGTYAETWAKNNGFEFSDNPVHAETVELIPSELTIIKGGTHTLALAVDPDDFTDEVSWKSSNESIATINDSGLVTAKALGSCFIKVIVGSKNAVCNITVVQPVTSISLNMTSKTLEAFETMELKATVNPSTANIKDVVWSISNPTVATMEDIGVDANGRPGVRITALTAGTTTITCKATDGSEKYATCTVTVSNVGHVVEDVSEFESSHNYSNNSNEVWQYTYPGETEQLYVSFDGRTALEDGFDSLIIYAGSTKVGEYTGTSLQDQTITVPGNVVRIRLKSDGSGNDWGFKVKRVSPTNAETLEDFTVTIPDAMSESVTITAPEGGWVIGENTFTVESEKACVLLVTNDGGQTYTRLKATASGDGYAFTADLTADSSIVCARKGDISGDGTISALEARQILMAGNGLYTLTPLQRMIADTNGDGTISALEARQILMAGNGLFTIGW